MIVLLGLPKSGTSSFQSLFTQLGYNSYHQLIKDKYIGDLIKKNKMTNIPLLSHFKKDDCITQLDVCISKTHCYWPQIIDYEQLYRENPDAIFILNKRNPEHLLTSFKRWNSLDKRLYTYNPELVQSKNDEGFITFVNQHYLNVETFFSSQLNAKFISYDIENDNIEKLTKYIDIKNIKIFPKENVNTNTNKT